MVNWVLYVPAPCQHLKTVSTDGGVGRQHEPMKTEHKLAALILVSVFLEGIQGEANPQLLEKVEKVLLSPGLSFLLEIPHSSIGFLPYLIHFK